MDTNVSKNIRPRGAKIQKHELLLGKVITTYFITSITTFPTCTASVASIHNSLARPSRTSLVNQKQLDEIRQHGKQEYLAVARAKAAAERVEIATDAKGGFRTNTTSSFV
ncbi:hypothetical protein K3495_g6953 [Podosphaera aphanis]|nr:hypothetical protein K3495_g6953 [Podosphaera aphanis]